ncbi:MAG: mandelate racemase/muconate lactonizing enzyme family protein [Gammaproteobacteria bacterium]
MSATKIAKIDTIPLRIPFDHGGNLFGWGGRAWTVLDVLLVRIETEGGLVGWGEAFSYNCRAPVQAIIDTMLTPILIGRDAADIGRLSYELQQTLHLFGRYGMTIFALSGIDIALWDLAGKAAQLPLYRLLGGNGAARLDAYASLFRYQDVEIVAERCKAALAEGYRYVKLHEIREPEVRAARDAMGAGIPLMVDTNCPWTPEQARAMAYQFKPYDIYWLEEPIFPPEDFAALAALQRETGIPIAAGENASTAFQFRDMFAAGAVRYAQPSVTKVGGVTEMRKIITLAEASAVSVVPHAPYFGPGFLATLHVLSATPNPGLVERLYVKVEASLYGDLIHPTEGTFRAPDGPGLGRDPDPDVIASYRVS